MVFILLCIVIGIEGLTAQTTKRITGTILSANDGEPVIGASVSIKGTAKGTVTNEKGIFEINIPSEVKTLEISYIGMKTKVVPVQPEMKILLDPQSYSLDEVIVTIYDKVYQEAFTGAAQTISSEKLSLINNADPMRALQGNIAGLQLEAITGQPGGFNEVQIRGLGSMNSGTQPLYIIDGIPITTGRHGMRQDGGQTYNPLSAINYADIESISILKDASATSIYGSRAANGVIVIDTKKGKSGKTKIHFSAKAGTTFIPARNEDYKMVAADEYYTFANELLANSNMVDRYDLDNTKKILTESFGLTLYPDTDIDWYKEVTRNGFTQDYNLDISGGNEKTRFFLSGGYYDENAIIINKDMQRYSVRMNLDTRITKALKVGINAIASYTKMNSGVSGGLFNDPITMAYAMIPVQPVYTPDGEWNMHTKNEYNPVAQQSKYGDKNITKNYRAILSPWLQFDFLENFRFRSNYGIDFMNLKEFGYWSWLQPSGKALNGRGEEGNLYTALWTWSNTLSWSKRKGYHYFNIFLGQEMQKMHEDNSYMAAFNYPSGTVWTIENASTPETAQTSVRNYSLASVFMNMEYNYNNKYYVSGNVRRDGSSRFGKKNRWGTFWSVGGKYRFSNEEFFSASNHWLSNGALKASYGTSGNQDVDWYKAKSLYRYGYSYMKNPGMVPSQTGNPDLKWEQTKKLNIGLELSFFNRFSIETDYYINKTTDMLFEVPISNSTGLESTMRNVGKMKNSGIELLLNYHPIQRRNISWSLSFNLTHNKNEILKLSTNKPIEEQYTIREAGRAYHTFKMKEYAGVDPETGAQLWYKGTEGKETTTDYNEAGKRYLGKADPKVYGGFSNALILYNFDFSFQLTYSLGGKVYNNSARYDENINNPIANTTNYVFKNMWREPGDITDVPAPSLEAISSHSSRFLMDGSYIKLQNIKIGYTFPSKLVKQLKIEKLHLYISSDNLVMWTLGKDFRGLSPETGMDGVLWWNFPISRNLICGLNVNF